MRWIKHLTLAHCDDALAYVIETFGAEAYGIYWLMIEHIAAPMEPGKFLPAAIHSAVKWSQICHCSVRRWRSIADTLAEKNLIELQSNGDRFEIAIPKILKYKDEYSKKSGQTPEQDREQIESRGRAEGEQIPPPQAPPENPAPLPPKNRLVPKAPPDFDGSDWFEKLYSRHPKKRDRGLAQSYAAQTIEAGADPAEIDRVHALCCGTDNWREKNGSFAPTLAQWFLDRGWKYPPEAKARDSPITNPAHLPYVDPFKNLKMDDA